LRVSRQIAGRATQEGTMNLIRFAAGAAIALTAIVSLAPAADAATVPTQTYTLNTVSNPHQVGRADVQFRAHTERISVTLDEGGLPAGDYTVKIVASAAGQVTVLDFQTKTVCTLHVSEWFGSGSCTADVHTHLLESGLPYTAISVYRSGSTDVYHPIATARVRYGVVTWAARPIS
jgi:hypothetical protein